VRWYTPSKLFLKSAAATLELTEDIVA